MTSNMIIDAELVHVSQAGNSGSIETYGLSRVLGRLSDSDITVTRLATDRSVQVSAMLRRNWPAIEHQFDVWHLDKSIKKKLHKKSKSKSMEALRAWIPATSNHLWWCASTCGGDTILLKEKWQSVAQHVCNVHSWVGKYS